MDVVAAASVAAAAAGAAVDVVLPGVDVVGVVVQGVAIRLSLSLTVMVVSSLPMERKICWSPRI